MCILHDRFIELASSTWTVLFKITSTPELNKMELGVISKSAKNNFLLIDDSIPQSHELHYKSL